MDIRNYARNSARLKEIRIDELKKDIRILNKEIKNNKWTREDNIRFLEMVKNELNELQGGIKYE